ncbi:MAG TPA: hypothetical protein VFW31_12490 [Candidatus Angelobacter sp.]|nr:hypothetical protein [Candidatus Angelobacter sp.]
MPPAYSCILLHGLFFMAFKNNQLIVTTPKFKPHKFGYRPQGITTIGSLPAGAPDINWTNVKLKDNSSSAQIFPNSVLQFSSSACGTGELLPQGKKNYEFTLALPRPLEIHSFRLSQLWAFASVAKKKPPKGNGKQSIRENVISSCGGGVNNPIALLTGLVYEQDVGCTIPHVTSFYAEHQMNCANIKAADVNKALRAAAKLFANESDFDLEFQDIPSDPVCPPDTDVYGVLKNDELSACELLVQDCVRTEGPNPINCAQFGVNG